MVKFYHNIAKSQSLNLFVLKNRKYSILYSNAFISVYFVFVLKSFYDDCTVFKKKFYTFVTMHWIRKHSRTNEIP